MVDWATWPKDRGAAIRWNGFSFGPGLVYTIIDGSGMKQAFEHYADGEFANGQNRRDSRGRSDAAELRPQLMETADNVGDFLRSIEISTGADPIKITESF